MPKRGGGQRSNNNGGNRFSSLKDYGNEHDDRSKDRNTTRRVSFKPLAGRRRIEEDTLKKRVALLDFDEDMADGASSYKYSESNARRKGSPIPKGKFGSRKLVPSSFGWYQVSLPYGARYSKDDILRALLNAISPNTFIAQYWRYDGDCVTFFVDDFYIAERFQKAKHNIQMPDGFRMFVNVRSGVPVVSIDERFKEKMKIVMAKRYNAHTRALDLSKFHADPDFKDMFCGLFRSSVMAAALDIISKNIPELEALNLNDNNISSLEAFKNVAERVPNLKILYLGDNKIPSLAHLLVFRSVPIIELVLKSNPLRQRYRDKALYISEVRRKFPKLLKLDGENLEPQILFDVNDVSSLPQANASFLCDGSAADIIRQFLDQYFKIFDSDNRQPLLDAYHQQAMLSMSIPPASQAGRLASFWKYNRNLRRIMNNEESIKYRQLKFGRLSVVSTLAEWPKTQHDRLSFSVDLTLYTPGLISFTVSGLFKELDAASSSNNNNYNKSNSSSDIRHFQRQLVIVPVGGGFCIRNELIFISSATNKQASSFLSPAVEIQTPQVAVQAAASLQSRLQQYHTVNPAAVPAVQIPASMLPSTSAAAAAGVIAAPVGVAASAAVAAPATAVTPDDATKLQMVQAMSAQSRMNLEWSRKCLEETNWDYNHAAFVFEKLKRENQIPAEAFAP